MTRLREWRHEAGYSLGEISDATGVSAAMLSRLETGKRKGSLRLKVLIARRLGVPLRDLFEVDSIEDLEDIPA